MKLTGDFHTHSIFSKFNHGKNTIAENYEQAKKLGLDSYGVTDHGPRHVFYGIRNGNFKRARDIVDAISFNNPDSTKIYLGVEANLIGKDGKIDISEDKIKMLDYLVVGYHKGTITNFVSLLFSRNSQKQIEKNTDAYINCVNKYNVAFFSHLNTYIKVNVKRLAEACAKCGTLIEINTRHFNFSEKEINDMLDTNVNFIISSDSHRASKIGFIDNALDVIKKYKIPIDRVVNINKTYIPKSCN